jgi:hypothetical protein
MELNLQPLAATSRVSSRPFTEGDRVVSYLVRSVINEIVRYDVLVDEDAGFRPERFKPKNVEDNPERLLKLTAENLFLTLADPANEPIPGNTPLLQFLALMLERKRILRPRGRTADGERNLLEHLRTHQMYEIAAGDLTPEFFAKIQEQLGVLVGAPKRSVAGTGLEKPPAAPPPATTAPDKPVS